MKRDWLLLMEYGLFFVAALIATFAILNVSR